MLKCRQTDGLMNGQTDRWTYEWTDRQMDLWMDRRTNGLMNGQTDKWTLLIHNPELLIIIWQATELLLFNLSFLLTL